MFLAKKWIFILIALTGISFMILLVIQFGWMEKSLELNRQQLDLSIRENSIKLRQSFLSDKVFQKAYLAESGERNDFIAASNSSGIGHAIKQKTDSILNKLGSPLSAAIYTRTGTYCYLMDYVPPGEHNTDIDNSQYKLCLCNNSCPLRLDIGFNVLTTGNRQGKGSSALVLPSVVLIFLLIALFAYAIYIINRQKKLAELKNDFINNLTHEFNTPLFSIGIASNLLLRSEPVQQSEKLKDYIELINTEKNRIQTQVDKILQLTALESGAVVMEKEIVDMHHLIKESMQSFENLVLEKGGTMKLITGANYALVKGDKLHLMNAINNLLDNASKYSEQAPEIAISTENNNGDLIIRIADKGLGISPSEKSMIFHKFYRIKQGDRHDVKGFGLGLSYVKKIVEMHKGVVDVETGVDKGAVFIIRLPYYSNQ